MIRSSYEVTFLRIPFIHPQEQRRKHNKMDKDSVPPVTIRLTGRQEIPHSLFLLVIGLKEEKIECQDLAAEYLKAIYESGKQRYLLLLTQTSDTLKEGVFRKIIKNSRRIQVILRRPKSQTIWDCLS